MDKAKKFDIEVKKIHKRIKKSNSLLRERMLNIQEELKTWDILGAKYEEGKDFVR